MHFGPNMTPMVDVVIVILIFFMSATAFMGPEWFLEAAIPAPGGSADTDPYDLPAATLKVELRAAQGVTLATGLGLSSATIDQLGARLDEIGTNVSSEEAFILLLPRPDVAYRDVVRVRDICERAGLTNVALGDP